MFVCSKSFVVKPRKPQTSKIVDYFPYFNEKEILELRINLLKDHVDKFVIVDANKSYTGKEKPFTCKNTLKELGLWDENKIQVIELDLHSDDDEIDFTDNFRVKVMGNRHLQLALNEDTENKIKAWCFGHYHKSVDRDHAGVRYVSNPKGRGTDCWHQTPYYPKRIEIPY
jgi:hypothetical protein